MRTIIRNDYDPKVGDYHDRIIIDETRKKKWLFDCDGIFTPLGGGGAEVVEEFGDSSYIGLSQKFLTEQFTGVYDNLNQEATERVDADVLLQNQIDELRNSPDVVDIVDTYADLQAYDTSKLGENDIIRVLKDETHEDKSAFYRWVNGAWDFIGTVDSGDTKSVELTQAEYDALSDAEKMNGTIYFITDGQGGGGGSIVGETFTTNITVGGLPSGTTINEDDTTTSVLKRMLTTVYTPTFTAPSVAINWSGSTLKKVGDNISAATVTEAFDAGAIMLQGTKQNDRAGAATGFVLATTGATTNFNETNTTGSFSVPALTRDTKGNIVATATVNFAQGPQPKDSNGDDYGTPLPAGSVTAAKTFEFILPFYWGASSTGTVVDFTGLTEDLSKKGQKQYTYATNNQHMVIAYDASYGNLTSILDPNNFETKDGWNKSTLTVGGNNYNVYVTATPTTDPSAKYTFKF